MGSYIVVVSGTPGTGKSSVGALLAERLGCLFVEAREVYAGFGALVPDETGRDSMLLDVERAGGAIAGFAGALTGCAVVSDISASLWLDNAGESVALVVLLRLHPLELKKRLEARGWSWRKVVENVLAEAFNVVAEELVEHSSGVVEVDCTGKSVAEVVDYVVEALGEWRTGVSIDWLERDPGLLELVSRLVAFLDSNEHDSRA